MTALRAALFGLLHSLNTSMSASTSPLEPSEDPYLWLEDVGGERALDWVKSRNTVTQTLLEKDPAFEGLRSDLLGILDSKERIPFVSFRGGFFYNFWRDKQNPRGLWRRTTREEYRKPEPQWEVLLDLDALGAKEGVNWVWAGVHTLKPDY